MSTNALPLDGRRILLVEDNFGIARSLSLLFKRYGALIVGPAATVEDAMALIVDEQVIDGAVLDVSVRDKLVYPVADALRKRSVPVVFVTGYDETFIAPEYSDIPCMLKPWNAERLMRMLCGSVGDCMPSLA